MSFVISSLRRRLSASFFEAASKSSRSFRRKSVIDSKPSSKSSAPIRRRASGNSIVPTRFDFRLIIDGFSGQRRRSEIFRVSHGEFFFLVFFDADQIFRKRFFDVVVAELDFQIVGFNRLGISASPTNVPSKSTMTVSPSRDLRSSTGISVAPLLAAFVDNVVQVRLRQPDARGARLPDFDIPAWEFPASLRRERARISARSR